MADYWRQAKDLTGSARRGLEALRSKQYILVMSHMRCYSSLLCHILNSNPEVAGYVETHNVYAGRADLWRLKRRVFWGTDADIGGRYVLDKILHNSCRVNPVLLRRDDVFVIFMLREPRRTIQSTVAMARKLNPDDWKADAGKVTQAYIRRVKKLRILAYQELRHAIFVDAQRLVDEAAPPRLGGEQRVEVRVGHRLVRVERPAQQTRDLGEAAAPREEVRDRSLVGAGERSGARANPGDRDRHTDRGCFGGGVRRRRGSAAW